MNAGSNSLNPDSSSPGSSLSSAAGRNGKTAGEEKSENAVLSEILRASGLHSNPGADKQSIQNEFLQVAKKYQDVEFSVSPIVTALVQVAVGKLSGISAESSAQLELFVANSICDDPESQARVRRIWESLVKTVKESKR